MLGSIFFIALNLADAWLTKEALALGAAELNPVVHYLGYADNLALKGLLALAIVFILCRLGKSHLFWYLNIAMLIVAFWNTFALITLQIYL